jgi:hypothetical protein
MVQLTVEDGIERTNRTMERDIWRNLGLFQFKSLDLIKTGRQRTSKNGKKNGGAAASLQKRIGTVIIHTTYY